jgi:hypothetical protein
MKGDRSAVAAAPAYVLAAKPDNGGSGNGDGGHADAAITEAVSAVTLAVEKIVAHRAGEAKGNTSEGTEKDGADGWEVLVATPQDIDLLKAANDPASANLGTSELVEGKYTQIRLYLKDAGNTITIHGVTHPLTVPSGALKLVGSATVEADKEYQLEVRFDLDHSLVMSDGVYKLKPTVKYSLSEK